MESYESRIEERPDGKGFMLIVDDAPAVEIVPVHGVLQCRWQVYGPWNLKKSAALMKGFIHVIALLDEEKQVNDRSPDSKEPVKQRRTEAVAKVFITPTKEPRWQFRRKIPRSST